MPFSDYKVVDHFELVLKRPVSPTEICMIGGLSERKREIRKSRIVHAGKRRREKHVGGGRDCAEGMRRD